MNGTVRLTVAAATLALAAGCASLRHKEKPPRVQGQLPGAPSLQPGGASSTVPGAGGPMASPTSSTAPGSTQEKSKFGFSEITPGL